jgi:hypothetical protein
LLPGKPENNTHRDHPNKKLNEKRFIH